MLLYVIIHQPSLRSANDKFEIPNSRQYSNPNNQITIRCLEHSNFGIGNCLGFGACDLGFKVIDCIFEDEQTITLTVLAVLQVIRVLDIGNMSLRMGHETENPPRAVGDAGNA